MSSPRFRSGDLKARSFSDNSGNLSSPRKIQNLIPRNPKMKRKKRRGRISIILQIRSQLKSHQWLKKHKLTLKISLQRPNPRTQSLRIQNLRTPSLRTPSLRILSLRNLRILRRNPRIKSPRNLLVMFRSWNRASKP